MKILQLINILAFVACAAGTACVIDGDCVPPGPPVYYETGHCNASGLCETISLCPPLDHTGQYCEYNGFQCPLTLWYCNSLVPYVDPELSYICVPQTPVCDPTTCDGTECRWCNTTAGCAGTECNTTTNRCDLECLIDGDCPWEYMYETKTCSATHHCVAQDLCSVSERIGDLCLANGTNGCLPSYCNQMIPITWPIPGDPTVCFFNMSAYCDPVYCDGASCASCYDPAVDCADEMPCTHTECTTDHFCSYVSDCAAGQVCKRYDEYCVECNIDPDCAIGVCGDNNTCVPECSIDGDCAAHTLYESVRCNATTERCESYELCASAERYAGFCLANSTGGCQYWYCNQLVPTYFEGVGYLCYPNMSQYCDPGMCNGTECMSCFDDPDSECTESVYCHHPVCTEDHFCLYVSDCPANRTCKDINPSVCVECNEDDDCADGICTNYVCVPECAIDGDCVAAGYYETAQCAANHKCNRSALCAPSERFVDYYCYANGTNGCLPWYCNQMVPGSICESNGTCHSLCLPLDAQWCEYEYCDGAMCSECDVAANCSDRVCYTKNCTGNHFCEYTPICPGQYCRTGSGSVCVDCNFDSQCAEGFCVNNSCVPQCTIDGDCVPPGPPVYYEMSHCTESGRCETVSICPPYERSGQYCAFNGFHCPTTLWYCNPLVFYTYVDAYCVPQAPVCDPTTCDGSTCLWCDYDSECSFGRPCDQDTHMCDYSCETDGDCVPAGILPYYEMSHCNTQGMCELVQLCDPADRVLTMCRYNSTLGCPDWYCNPMSPVEYNPSTYVCMPTPGHCNPEYCDGSECLWCDTTADCDAGQICDPDAHVCIIECAVDGDCNTSKYYQTGVCNATYQCETVELCGPGARLTVFGIGFCIYNSSLGCPSWYCNQMVAIESATPGTYVCAPNSSFMCEQEYCDGNTCTECVSSPSVCVEYQPCHEASCSPDHRCVETPVCDVDQYCNVALERCDECLATGDCPVGQYCNTTFGTCVECLLDDDCGDMQACDGSVCVRVCADFADCQLNETCYAERCIPCAGDDCSECLGPEHCAESEICVDGHCVYECNVFADCPAGENCTAHRCVPCAGETCIECTVADDCTPQVCQTLACTAGRCIYTPRTNYTRCASGPTPGACLGGACVTVVTTNTVGCSAPACQTAIGRDALGVCVYVWVCDPSYCILGECAECLVANEEENCTNPGLWHCDETIGACVACTANAHCAAPGVGGSPECRPDNTCYYGECVRASGFWYLHAAWAEEQLLLPVTVGNVTVSDSSDIIAVLGRGISSNWLNVLAASLLTAQLNIAAGASSAPIADAVATAATILDACPANDQAVWLTAIRGRTGCHGFIPRVIVALCNTINAYNEGRSGVELCTDIGAAVVH